MDTSNTRKHPVSNMAVRRLPRYYRVLCTWEEEGVERTSSRQLGDVLGLTPSQVRQDLHCFGCHGVQGSGYVVSELRESLEDVMGLSDKLPTILIGAGSLGKVVAENVRFEERGFSLIGIFDVKPELFQRTLAGLPIRPMETLAEFCRTYHPVAAVLCVPKESAQAAAEQLIHWGITGLWNFSHGDIIVTGAQVVTVHLDDSLMTLSYKLHHNTDEEDR